MAFNQENIMQMHLIKYDLFKSQNPETGQFDVMFEVGGKLLYAHKNMLNLVSTTFASMLSDRWTTKDQPIKIKDYSYDNFYQFLLFLYSGQCQLTDENIFTMVDMAEFYGIESFKKYCDKYLAAIEITDDNIFKLMDLAEKYSMAQLKASTHGYIVNNIQSFSDCEGFLTSDKSFIEEIAVTYSDKVKPEDLFQAVYKWAEKQAIDKQAANQNVNLNDAIKAEISDLLPFIQFQKMELIFMVQFLVSRCFIFSSLDVLSKLMSDRLLYPSVKVTNFRGQTLHGNLISDKSVLRNIESLNLSVCSTVHEYYCYWNTRFTIPSSPSPLKKRDSVEWYLVYFSGTLGIFNHRYLHESYYLLAELTAGDSEFDTTSGSKIEIE